MIHLLTQIDGKLEQLLRQHIPDAKEPLLTIAEAAAVANVSPTTIRRAKNSKGPYRLDTINVGNGPVKPTLRIDPKVLDAWINRREEEPPAPAVRTVRVPAAKSGQFKF